MARPRPLFFLSLVLLFSASCATAPKVSEVFEASQSASAAPVILSAKGHVSSEAESRRLIRSLAPSEYPKDLMERQTAVMEHISGTLLSKGNRVTLLADGEGTYSAMFAAIRDAKETINLETFIFDDSKIGKKFADLLISKRSEGVEVNIIFDSVGCLSVSASFFRRMRQEGVRVLEFNPVNPFKTRGSWHIFRRDHRKILVVDGKIAFTGGVNISSVYAAGISGMGQYEKGQGYQRPWRDTDIKVEGPAVADFQKLFFETWYAQKGPELPEQNYFPQLTEMGNDLVLVIGSSSGERNRITFVMYVSAIDFAETSLHITNAYFVPDRQTLASMIAAAGRGVDVKIILPKESDNPLALYAGRFYYSNLLKAGVKLYARRNVVLHAKTAVIDGVWSTVGSTNMDFWSLLHNDEVNAVIISREFAAEMERMFSADLSESDEITLEEWRNRPLLPRLREWFLHLFSHVL